MSNYNYSVISRHPNHPPIWYKVPGVMIKNGDWEYTKALMKRQQNYKHLLAKYHKTILSPDDLKKYRSNQNYFFISAGICIGYYISTFSKNRNFVKYFNYKSALGHIGTSQIAPQFLINFITIYFSIKFLNFKCLIFDKYFAHLTEDHI